MTRTYNKNATALPYAPGAIKRSKAQDVDEMYGDEEQEHEEEENEESDPENDALIKVLASNFDVGDKPWKKRQLECGIINCVAFPFV